MNSGCWFMESLRNPHPALSHIIPVRCPGIGEEGAVGAAVVPVLVVLDPAIADVAGFIEAVPAAVNALPAVFGIGAVSELVPPSDRKSVV